MWRCMNAQTRGHCRAWMHTTGIAAGADLPWASPSSVMGASDSNSALTSTPCGMCMRCWGTPSRGHPHGYSPDPMIGIRTDTHQGLPTSAAAHPGAIPAIAGTESNFLVAWPGGGRRGRKDASKRPDKPVDFLQHLSEWCAVEDSTAKDALTMFLARRPPWPDARGEKDKISK